MPLYGTDEAWRQARKYFSEHPEEKMFDFSKSMPAAGIVDFLKKNKSFLMISG